MSLLKKNYKKEFLFLTEHPGMIYFDSAGTSLMPRTVIKTLADHYIKYGVNLHAKASPLAHEAHQKVDKIRARIANFIQANRPEEIIFTPGTTAGLNYLAWSLQKTITATDNIAITKFEHISNLAPWIRLTQTQGAQLRYLESETIINPQQLAQQIDQHTKILVLASVHNVNGFNEPIAEIVAASRQINPEIIVVCDAAQSICYLETNVQKWDIDYLIFGAHKMYGPFGTGVVWGRFALLSNLEPAILGGGEIQGIRDLANHHQQLVYQPLPARHEAGSFNVPGVFALNAALDFIQDCGGPQAIYQHLMVLKNYFLQQCETRLQDKIILYNHASSAEAAELTTPLVLFTVKSVPSEDVAIYLEKKHQIILRSGDFCVKQIDKLYGCHSLLRVSFNVYNSLADVDTLVKVLAETDDYLEDF